MNEDDINRKTLGIFASGELGFLCLKELHSKIKIVYIFTNKKSNEIINYGIEKGIPVFVGDPKKKSYELFIYEKEVDFIISVNYLFILPEEILLRARSFSLNIHGSLLPFYRGRTPHVWAIINNESYTGVTVHLMTKGCDEGDIVLQKKIKIKDNHTGFDILQIFKSIYPKLLFDSIIGLSNGEIKPRKQDLSKGSYYGPRKPEDGRINWDWSKERIYNWVRAQAPPYPGAFCYFKESKIVVEKVSLIDNYINQLQRNGEIISIHPLVIKTVNGALLFEKFNSVEKLNMIEGDCLE